MSWCTIESDPGVFTELIERFGVHGVGVEEVFTLDDIVSNDPESLQSVRDIFGLVFLFKWQKETDPRPIVDSESFPNLYFAAQKVPNACATQAILSVLLNNPDIDLGRTLRDFKEFAVQIDPESRGFSIGHHEEIRTVHNSFARPEPFFHEEDKSRKGKKEDAYHFVAYIPHEGRVFELDGLKEGPIDLGTIGSEQTWLDVAQPAIAERMLRYSANETHFALMKICRRRSQLLENELNRLNTALENGEDVLDKISAIRQQLIEEEAVAERQRAENDRRRHNYIPLAVAILRHMAKKGALKPLIK